MPQTLPGSSSANPSSQSFSYCPNRDAVYYPRSGAPVLREVPLSALSVPTSSGLAESNCTSLRVYQNDQACVGKRPEPDPALTRVIGISQGIRVPAADP